MSVITLTTDFGTEDWFVGTMRGVILGIHPRATVVDLCHGVPTGNIRAGAFALAAGCRFFPRGTVHVLVVDPGVGSTRPGLAVRTAEYVFVGPDNGSLSWALARENVRSVRRLENTDYFLQPVSKTFHGRDVFASMASHLSKGTSFSSVGPEVKDYVRLPWPSVTRSRDTVRGEVLYLDRFGNAITNIENLWLGAQAPPHYVLLPVRRRVPVRAFYQAVPAARAVCVPGSAGYLEVAVNGGSAAKLLRLKVGDPVVLVPHSAPRRGHSSRIS